MSGGVDSAVAAAPAACAQGSGHPGEREVDTDDVVSRLDGAGCGNGGIDAAAHGCKNSHTDFLWGRVFGVGVAAGTGGCWTQS